MATPRADSSPGGRRRGRKAVRTAHHPVLRAPETEGAWVLGRQLLVGPPRHRTFRQPVRSNLLGGEVRARGWVVLREALLVQIHGKRQEGVDEGRVEMRAADGPELADDVVQRPGVLVGAR